MQSALWPTEKSLILGKWASESADLSQKACSLAKETVGSNFKQVLTSSEARGILRCNGNSKLDSSGHSGISNLSSQFTLGESTSEEEELLRLSVAISSLQAFVQTNWTGPDLDFAPLDVLSFSPEHPNPTTSEEELNQKSISELSYGGEPFYHLAKHATFLRIAQVLLDLPYLHCRSVPWWRLRASLVHLQGLDEPVAFPPTLLSDLQPLAEQIATDPVLHGRLLLEQGLLHHATQADRTAAELFVKAARATGLQYELTGALGKKTKFQQKELSQLVLLAESRLAVSDESEQAEKKEGSSDRGVDSDSRQDTNGIRLPATLALNDDTLLERTAFTSTSSGDRGDSALSHLDPSSQPALHPLDQCILLGLCLNVKNTSPVHGLTSEQMAPYVDRVITHPKNWSVHTMALLLRARLESNRSRTIERAVLQLQALIDQMPTADSAAGERLEYFHGIELPSKWDMERELANRFLSLGVVKSAMEIFERLEMWEEVVKCWQVLERPEKGVTIVKDLLEGRKEESEVVVNKGKEGISESRRLVLGSAREAKLWCLLGDLEAENAVSHYQRAWAISNETSGRAVRSLGGYSFARGHWKEAVEYLNKAVSINPLLSRSWFILGCAYAKLEDWEGGRKAFTRCVGIDSEDGESWSNLASMYLRMGAPIESEGNEQNSKVDEDEVKTSSVPFSNKLLAFRALQQGLKFSYENWKMWSNYMIVAVDVGELAEAARAMRRVVEQTSGSSTSLPVVDEDVLDRLVDAVTRANPNDDKEKEQNPGAMASDDAVGSNGGQVYNPNEGRGLLKTVLGLIEETLLPRTSSPRVFRAYARLLTWQGRWADVIKAHLDAYRFGRTVDLVDSDAQSGTDGGLEKWREEVRNVEDIVDVLRNFGPRAEGAVSAAADSESSHEVPGEGAAIAGTREGSFKWRNQARSIVRTFISRHKDFQDEPEWESLQELLDGLKKDAD